MAKVRTRKRGKTFSYSFEAGRTPEGKRKVVEKGGFATKKEAYDAGTIAYADWQRGDNSIVSEAVTLDTFMKNWLDNVCAMNVRETSIISYRGVAKNHILPTLGKIRLQKITPAVLDKWARNQAKAGFSYKTIKLSFALLRQVLNYAVYPCELISNNPLSYVKIPRSAPKKVVERTIITTEQFADMLNDFPVGHPFRIVLLLLYHTGMRIGEVCGLDWQDVDFTAKTIHIKQQLRRIIGKSVCIVPTKSASSVRTIGIGDELLSELKSWKHTQAQNELRRGGSYIALYKEDNELRRASKTFIDKSAADCVHLVCTKNNGAPIETANVFEVMRRYHCNSHSFRHTHATMLAEAGASAKEIASRLGHSNTLITENLYMHMTDEMMHHTSDVFESLLQQKMQTK